MITKYASIDNVLSSLSESKSYTDALREEIENQLGIETSTIEPKENDIPKVFISGSIPTSKTEVDAEMTYISKTLTFSCYLKIKCQGTSSLSYNKKNFTIKMFSDVDRTTKLKKNFKGWGEQNKFCLKANWIDLSHARNIVSAQLWGDIVKSRANFESLPTEYKTSPNVGAVDGFPILVYCNGIYWGRYTWNIPKDGWMSNMDDSLDTHCILCSENYNSGCFRSLAVIDKTDWTDELHDTVPDSIVTSFNNAISFVLESSDETFVSDIENYFNLESLIDYYIFSYAICHLDGLGKNQLFFTYDGIHWIAGAYDMDSTWGLYWDGSYFVSTSYKMQEEYETAVNGTSNLLYDRLSVLFAEQIKARWIELRQNILSDINIVLRFENFMQNCSKDLMSFDYDTTTGNGAFTEIPSQYDNHIGQIREYAVKRLKYVNSKLNPSTSTEGTETILRENYSPAGDYFSDDVNMNFSAGDYIEVSMDLSGCYGTWENILSVGDNIASWTMSGGYHIYYTADSAALQINTFSLKGHVATEYGITDPTNVIIKIDQNGIYLNSELVATSESLLNISAVEIGSMEGYTRSNALYKYIKVSVV